jgi:hypothetical protein
LLSLQPVNIKSIVASKNTEKKDTDTANSEFSNLLVELRIFISNEIYVLPDRDATDLYLVT